MIQIGLQPSSAAFAEGCRSSPDGAMGDHSGPERRLASDLPEEPGDGILFVSPPPLPFPRVFPGL